MDQQGLQVNDLGVPGEAQQKSGDELPRRVPEGIQEFGSESRQIDKHAGLCFKLDRSDRRQLPRTMGSQVTPDDDDEEEVILVIEGVRVPCTQNTSFDVFVNLPEADHKTPLTAAEYVGTYYHVPHAAHAGRETVTNVRLGIGDTLKQVGISDLDHLVVSLVPKGAGPDDIPITVSGARLEYE